MPPWTQHIAVAVILAGSVAYLARGLWQTVRGKASTLGSCCATGCSPTRTATPPVQIVPVDQLVLRARQAGTRRRANDPVNISVGTEQFVGRTP